MYAVFRSGGKQYRVSLDTTVRLEKLEIIKGEIFEFHKILMISDGKYTKIGAPFVKGAKVKGEIIAHGRDKKIKIIKFNRRKHSRKQQGHRQWFTEVKITSIA
ncbi:50S ribosomal protein L21 [Arsenophonus symbiont of Ornithomya chloropus]|uniref:50S ribosomal protein L21 n=1 Tax=Arsenophonus symbiont of Ornithomya chloropus TaxID=634121 RepID=UPI0032B246E6